MRYGLMIAVLAAGSALAQTEPTTCAELDTQLDQLAEKVGERIIAVQTGEADKPDAEGLAALQEGMRLIFSSHSLCSPEEADASFSPEN